MQAPFLSQSEFEKIFQHHLKVSSYSMSIRSLFGERMLRKINYEPYYQRNYVWDQAKATFFIESILLGTDIPPLVFFNSGGTFEVIDGRQRFETIKRFKSQEFSLKSKGLLTLPQLKGKNYTTLSGEFVDLFEDVKIRIFEFEVINEPRLESALEDRIKKEIFRRYNSGITSLNTAEIDNAIYDTDPISVLFKKRLKDVALNNRIKDCFSLSNGSEIKADNAKILQFLRKNLVLTQFPISHYARTGSRTETFTLLYDIASQSYSENQDKESLKKYVKSHFDNINLVLDLKDYFTTKNFIGNKIMFECILWAISVVSKEQNYEELFLSEQNKEKLLKYYSNNKNIYSVDSYHYYKSIIERYKNTSSIFNEIFNVDYSLYLKDDNFSSSIKDLKRSEGDAILKMEALQSLRVNKPEPSSIPVDELMSDLKTKRYEIRPSYQRQEKINVKKASAIIESIILGIYLPPIFIFKNSKGIKEVIDGQQRILSILGFLGKEYLNETEDLVRSKNDNYKLSGLKILKNLNKQSYLNLDVRTRDKILDFRLQIIEIDSKLNPSFESVDLFIRLNNKPYPILENSFEMWNSFADSDVIQKIKKITKENIDWFFVKDLSKRNSINRMQNEELITILSYILFNREHRPSYNSIGYFQRQEKITGRITDKKDISNTIDKLSIDIISKESFLLCIDKIETYLVNLKQLLNPTPKIALDDVLDIGGTKGVKNRSLIDFYLLFELLISTKTDSYKNISIDEFKTDIQQLKMMLKNPSGKLIDADYYEQFIIKKESLVEKYTNL